MLRRIALTGVYGFLRHKFVARSFPFNNPSILLLSYPRSGSSWVGKILSTSTNVAYLREPITQAYLKKRGGKYALVDLNDSMVCSIYRELSDEAFRGIPSRQLGVVNDLHDFAVFQRGRKHLLIKEVNPKAINFYCKQYDPKILLLLRHPAAVALSFSQQGWLDSADVQLDTGNPEASAWEKFGYAYGSTMKCALETIKNCANHLVVKYENLALDPEQQFEKIFRLLELEIPRNYDEVIQEYCYSRERVENAGEIKRASKDMVYKWYRELSSQEILSVRKGFILSGLEFYLDETDWRPG